MANMDSVTNSTGPIKRREQLKRPFRILVKKTSVIANYPLRHILVLYMHIQLAIVYILVYMYIHVPVHVHVCLISYSTWSLINVTYHKVNVFINDFTQESRVKSN